MNKKALKPVGRVGKLGRLSLTVFQGALIPIALLITWELLARAGTINPVFFPPPSKLAELFVELSADGTLWRHLGKTLSRLLPALAIGATTGLLFGLILGARRLIRKFLEPSLLAIYSIPKIALLPIFLATLGVGESAMIGLISVSVFFYVWIYTMGAVLRTPSNLIITAKVFGASRFRLISSIILRSALPEAMSGLRVGATVALLVGLTSEYVLGADGIGYLILGARSLGQHGLSYLGILVAAVCGLALQYSVMLLDRLVNPWVRRGGFLSERETFRTQSL
jgi:ABC-type nitrate/sulfonate/bicarbonate transport system permease component